MTTRRGLLALGLGAAFAPIVGGSQAWAGSWVDLGSRKVKANTEADRFVVSDNGMAFTRLRFQVSGNSIFLGRASVYFGNGKSLIYVFDDSIAEGAVSASIDLPGNRRAIRYVDVTYQRSKNGRGGALVTLQGLTA